MPRPPLLLALLVPGFIHAAEPPPEKIDVSQWIRPEFGEDFFKDHTAAGEEALKFWMQTATFRGDPGPHPAKRTEIERLWSDDPVVVAKVNADLLASAQKGLADVPAFRKKGPRQLQLWMELALRAREQMEPATRQAILDLVKAVDVSTRKRVRWDDRDTRRQRLERPRAPHAAHAGAGTRAG